MGGELKLTTTIRREIMGSKVLVRLNLSRYSVEDLFHLFRLRILNRDEIMSEMRERGMKDLEIIGRIRQAG